MDELSDLRSPWARVFLARLDHLCHLNERHVLPPDILDDPRLLANKAIFATYLDCVACGCKDDALQMLSATGHWASVPPSASRAPARGGPAR